MSARSIVVFHVRQQNVPQVSFPDHHDVVVTFPADRADQSLRTAILPRRSRRDRLVADAQRSHATNEYLAVAGISITDQMADWQATLPSDARLLQAKGYVAGCVA